MTPQLDNVSFLVVESALARAPKHNTDSTGTDYLLRQISDGPLEIWDELKPVKHALSESRQGAKAVGYLMAVAATGDEPARWETHERIEETSASSPSAPDLREAAWRAILEGKPLVGWTGDFVGTIERALAGAAERGSDVADIRDFALALVCGPANRATEALQKGGADMAGAPARIAAMPPLSSGARTPSLDALEHTGALEGPTKKRGLFARLSGHSETPTVGSVVATEAVRQAVRSGAAEVTAEHVLAAVASVQDQVVRAGRAWLEEDIPLVGVPALVQAEILIPASWPSGDQELPRSIASLRSCAEVLAAVS